MSPSPHRGQIGTPLEIRLSSAIVRATWSAPAASQGGEIFLQAELRFVANGSEVQVDVRDDQGKTVGTVKGKTFSGTFRQAYRIPKTESKTLVFVAKLPAHKLEATSPPLQILPHVEIAKPTCKDPSGKSLTEIGAESTLTTTWEIHGALPGTTFEARVLAHIPDHAETCIWKGSTTVEQLKASIAWSPRLPSEEGVVPCQHDRKPTGETYQNPEFVVEGVCQGIKAPPLRIPYVSWVEFDLGAVRGEVDLQFPDGRTETKLIPENGLVRVAGPKAGKIGIRAVRPKP